MAKASFTDEDVAKVLLNARELMNNRGKHWIKWEFRRKNKNGELCYCSIGAIRAAAPGDKNKRLRAAAFRALAQLIDPNYADGTKTAAQSVIMSFNDSDSTKWGDVSKLFRKAARSVLK